MKAKREMIQELSEEYPARLLCRVLDVSPSSYYYRPQGQDDLLVLPFEFHRQKRKCNFQLMAIAG